MSERPKEVTLKLNQKDAEVVATALNHVWREIMDKSYSGDGAILRKYLDQLNTITEGRR